MHEKKLRGPAVYLPAFDGSAAFDVVKSVVKAVFQSAIRAVRHLLSPRLNSFLFGAPIGVTNVEPYCRENRFPYDVLTPGEKYRRADPKTLEDDVHWKFNTDFFRDYKQPDIWIAELNNASVVGGNYVVTSDGRVIHDITILGGDEAKKSLSEHTRTTLQDIRLRGKSVMIGSEWTNNHYHWFTDSLPRLHILQKSKWPLQKIDTLILPRGLSSAAERSLRVLGIPAEKCHVSKPEERVRADTLILPSLPGHTGKPSRWVAEFLRNTYLSYSARCHKNFPRRFYIGRRTHRRVINEDELVSLLNKYDVSRIYVEDYSFEQQISMFKNAELVIAPHGAGLTNLLFSTPGTKVLEFFSPNFVNPCFYWIADLCDLDYTYVLGNGTRPPQGVDPRQNREDIEVPVEKVFRYLQSMDSPL